MLSAVPAVVRIFTQQDRAYWLCDECGKRGPLMLRRHAREAARWHNFLHQPGLARR